MNARSNATRQGTHRKRRIADAFTLNVTYEEAEMVVRVVRLGSARIEGELSLIHI